MGEAKNWAEINAAARRLTALHEAAHACVAMELGYAPEFVTVGAEMYGGAKPGGGCMLPEIVAEHLVDVLLAGLLAERRALEPGTNLLAFLMRNGGAPDLSRVTDLARLWAGDDGDQAALGFMLSRAAAVAEQVEILWPTIEAIASALVAKGRIEGAEVAAIYRRVAARGAV